ncbi:ABC transporter ATP-binding protein [Hyphococcus sp. DH-69]|uniref:ABC transporter ATP-binding protein n=1 Tax=Hyphococcus formosus TaxID=3143534 RepID=UPI00398B1ACB
MTDILDVKSLHISLGGTSVLHDVSFRAGTNEFIGLVGPNGAGKSTLLRAIAGLAAIDSGYCRIKGKPVDFYSPIERAQHISYLPQARPVYWSMLARDIVALGRFAYGSPLKLDDRDQAAVANALKDAGAESLADRPVAELSGGERARIHLARTLATETPLILADEPIAALDPAHQLSVMRMLRGKADAGHTIIAALHELPLASRYCTRIIILADGRVTGDNPSTKLSPELIETVFGVTPIMDSNGVINGLLPLTT